MSHQNVLVLGLVLKLDLQVGDTRHINCSICVTATPLFRLHHSICNRAIPRHHRERQKLSGTILFNSPPCWWIKVLHWPVGMYFINTMTLKYSTVLWGVSRKIPECITCTRD